MAVKRRRYLAAVTSWGLTARAWAAGVLAGAALLAVPASAPAVELVGSMHEHSAYSDGWLGSRPADYYASGRAFGLDFMGGSDHSDTFPLPIAGSEACLGIELPSCLLADTVDPLDSFRKWAATGEQAAAASDDAFTAFRGFEWTSDRFGHINVYFSSRYRNAKLDGGYVTMGTFWRWLLRDPGLGGGADGVATFNHPGAKKLSEGDPGFNWNDFAYVPAADSRMVGIEVFNDSDDFGSSGPPEGWYAHALDEGWHLGAVGAEDLGHRRSDDWGGPGWAKTVIDAADRSPEAIEAALKARHFYAVRDGALRLGFSVDGEGMGSRLRRLADEQLPVSASVTDKDLKLELVTSGGEVVATGDHGELHGTVAADRSKRWYFVRALAADGRPMAYSSPVWVDANPVAAGREWLAGDFHVHTCFSHDAYCGPGDDNTGIDEIYTLSLPVGARFSEANLRGLDFLTITDHNDVRSVTDPGFGTAGVIGVPGYESSLNGHAQMLGATRVYPKGDGSVADVEAQAAALHADGGLFQINHPVSAPGTINDCDPAELDWSYGYSVRPDALEVWNLATPGLNDSTRWWECWLDRGVRLPATGGSDSHWLVLAAVMGVGNPTTWVLSDARSADGVLGGVAAGRTSITRLPPILGATPLTIEADPDRDGTFEPAIGSDVEGGTPLRISGGGPIGGLVRVRADGETILDDAFLAPGGHIDLDAPAEDGWLRAEMRFLPGALQDLLGCTGVPGLDFVPCLGDQAMAALSSPVYLEASPPGGSGAQGGGGSQAGATPPASNLAGVKAKSRRCTRKRQRPHKPKRACRKKKRRR